MTNLAGMRFFDKMLVSSYMRVGGIAGVTFPTQVCVYNSSDREKNTTKSFGIDVC